MAHGRDIVVHDSFRFRGGGERVALTLCHELSMDLAYGYRASKDYPLVNTTDIRSYDLLSYARFNTPVIGTLSQIRRFRRNTTFLANYHNVIYSGTEALFAVANHRSGKNIYYCHTPPRFIYDLRDYYFSRLSAWRQVLLKAHIAYVQPRYEESIRYMDVVVANSENVQRRLWHYLGVKSVVIYPPCEISRFRWLKQGDYYLSVARHDPLKRIDVIVEAFKQMPHQKLVVSSTGGETARLRGLASGNGNIVFTGPVSDSQLAELMGRAIATIYVPLDEDFGISPVESMAAGKPVIGCASGGLVETILDGVTGRLLPAEVRPEDIIATVLELSSSRAMEMRQACEDRAKLFDKSEFCTKMRELLA